MVRAGAPRELFMVPRYLSRPTLKFTKKKKDFVIVFILESWTLIFRSDTKLTLFESQAVGSDSWDFFSLSYFRKNIFEVKKFFNKQSDFQKLFAKSYPIF